MLRTVIVKIDFDANWGACNLRKSHGTSWPFTYLLARFQAVHNNNTVDCICSVAPLEKGRIEQTWYERVLSLECEVKFTLTNCIILIPDNHNGNTGTCERSFSSLTSFVLFPDATAIDTLLSLCCAVNEIFLNNEDNVENLNKMEQTDEKEDQFGAFQGDHIPFPRCLAHRQGCRAQTGSASVGLDSENERHKAGRISICKRRSLKRHNAHCVLIRYYEQLWLGIRGGGKGDSFTIWITNFCRGRVSYQETTIRYSNISKLPPPPFHPLHSESWRKRCPRYRIRWTLFRGAVSMLHQIPSVGLRAPRPGHTKLNLITSHDSNMWRLNN